MEELLLFGTAFIAATLLPLSSEAAFLLALHEGMPITNAMIASSMGNILGISTNYYFGYMFYTKSREKIFALKYGKKYYTFVQKYALVSLLLSWLPLVGDTFTIIAGLLRLRFTLFIFLAGGLRVLRYYFLYLML